MIGIYNKQIQSIPVLEVVDQVKQNETLPLFIYSHGFTSAKEQNLPIAYLMAEAGFRVVLPDSKFHGERTVEITSKEMQISFWNIVMKNVAEIEVIKNAYESKRLILNHRIGVAGTSMGGITTSASLTMYPWIKVAGVLMGSPKITTYAKTLVNSFRKLGDLPITEDMIDQLYKQLEMYDLSKQMNRLNNRPLLFWHGANDAVVPFDHSYTFCDEARKYYKNPEELRFIQEEKSGHKVSRNAILETVKWFKKYL